MWAQIAQIDVLRSLSYTSITGAYAAVGAAFGFSPRLICITNNTNGDMLFSNDGVNDKLFIPKNAFKLFDIATNKGGMDGIWCLPIGTQIYVKQSTAATSGAVYVELIYGADT